MPPPSLRTVASYGCDTPYINNGQACQELIAATAIPKSRPAGSQAKYWCHKCNNLLDTSALLADARPSLCPTTKQTGIASAQLAKTDLGALAKTDKN